MANGLSLFEPSSRKSRERELKRNEREVAKRLAKEQRKFEREDSVKPFFKVTVEEPPKKEYSYEGMGKPIGRTKQSEKSEQSETMRDDMSAKGRAAFAKRAKKALQKQEAAERKRLLAEAKAEKKESDRKSKIDKLKKETELYSAEARHKKAKQAAHPSFLSGVLKEAKKERKRGRKKIHIL